MSISKNAAKVCLEFSEIKVSQVDLTYQAMAIATDEDKETALFKATDSEIKKVLNRSGKQVDEHGKQTAWIDNDFLIPVSIGDGFVKHMGDLDADEVMLQIDRKMINAQNASASAERYRQDMMPIFVRCTQKTIKLKAAVISLGLDKEKEIS